MIEDTNKALFIHLAKTGGSSITTALNPYIIKYGSPSFPPTSEYIKSLKLRFSFVRNPYTRFASIVLNLGHATPETFTEFVTVDFWGKYESISKDWFGPDNYSWFPFIPQHKFLYHDGKLEVDFLGRFERLDLDFHLVCLELFSDQVFNVHLTHENKSNTSGTDYEKFYTPETKRIVAEAYKEDFERFGYEL